MTPLGLFGSLGPSLLAFTLHRPWSIGVNLRLTFTTHRRPPCRIHHLHITSQEQRHTQLYCQSLITQRERTSLGSSVTQSLNIRLGYRCSTRSSIFQSLGKKSTN